MHIILCHENADFDAVAAMLAAHKLNPVTLPVLPDRLNSNVARFLALYRAALPFVARQDYQPDALAAITLVDTQRVPQIKGLKPGIPVHIIDHHPPSREFQPNETFSGDTVGAATTLLVEQMQPVSVTPLEATLLALGIYEDTGSLVYGETTPRDLRAAAWLVERGAVLDDVRRFLEPPLSDEQQALLERLVASADSRQIGGYTVTVAAAAIDTYMYEVSAVAHRLRDTLDPAALFLLVQMPSALHLVCRSTDDAVDAGAIARFFGGGGHERAAAATIHDYSLDQAIAALWDQLYAGVRPAVRVSDLMSRGAQTLDPAARLENVIRRLRRIGHEGFPVVENGRVIGLLTRRDADRALEHGLGGLAVRDVMSAGEVTLAPDDSVAQLETRMVESGWGQIPVVDDGRLVGIVTRTDLIKHWAKAHPAVAAAPAETLSRERLAAVLGEPAAALIERIARHAQEQHVSLYLVGGVVRDLLLERPNLDIDFVVEGDAIRFAQGLQARYGGDIHSYRPFGTATWILAGSADGTPASVDFATARNEFYEHPTALPTVYSGSIKLDLGRRDFTMNTLAVQLSPAQGRILDFFGGLADLDAGVIRVLHSLSFVDDPTRILRAVRFERRLGFRIETRTTQLIETALPMLRRITGERVRNELTLLLGEADPADSFLLLQARGILKAIHPAFVVPDDLPERFERASATQPPWPMSAPPLPDLYWCVMLAGIPAHDLADLSARLVFARGLAETILAAARLVQNLDGLTDAATPPSKIVARLDSSGDLALYVAWLLVPNALARERIRLYASSWRGVRPTINGHMLRARGLEPGPCYAVILARLRAARLDGAVTNDDEELRLLETLLQGGICDDSAE